MGVVNQIVNSNKVPAVAAGLCCHNCRFRPSGYMCRMEENECDLAEYCNGTSGFLSSDTYKQDGTPCKYEAHCFKQVVNPGICSAKKFWT